MIRIVLASESPARKRLLKRLWFASGPLKKAGSLRPLRFTTCPANIDETAVQKRIKNPTQLVRELSLLKARTVAQSEPKAVVIGGDQVLVARGKIFGKPHTRKRAIEQLSELSGKSVELLTGVAVVQPDGTADVVVHRTVMKFRRLNLAEIIGYVDLDQPLGCAGSFKFESYGMSLFESVATNDPSAIEGLPLLHLHKMLLPMIGNSKNDDHA